MTDPKKADPKAEEKTAAPATKTAETATTPKVAEPGETSGSKDTSLVQPDPAVTNPPSEAAGHPPLPTDPADPIADMPDHPNAIVQIMIPSKTSGASPVVVHVNGVKVEIATDLFVPVPRYAVEAVAAASIPFETKE